jgi:hypothetical protein
MPHGINSNKSNKSNALRFILEELLHRPQTEPVTAIVAVHASITATEDQAPCVSRTAVWRTRPVAAVRACIVERTTTAVACGWEVLHKASNNILASRNKESISIDTEEVRTTKVVFIFFL